MKSRDCKLGMDREITRRDFIHDVGLGTVGLSLTGLALGGDETIPLGASKAYYPPTLTGMRGSHPGSFEVAHALARGGKKWAAADRLDEEYDLVVVGGGISGLAAAWYYRKQFGDDSRILILENHDDFGGHAKRNEFHQGGPMRLAWGGAINLEYPAFSKTVKALLSELGVDIERLLAEFDFDYGGDGKLGPAIYFDKETYGRDVLVPGFSLRYDEGATRADKVDGFPLDDSSRASLKRFFGATESLLKGQSRKQQLHFLQNTGYLEFLTEHAGLTAEAAALFVNTTHGYWGIGADSLSIAECIDAGLPGANLLGLEVDMPVSIASDIAMFPDGNASIARLLVRGLIPTVAKNSGDGKGMDDIATARFDYAQLDTPGTGVRLRLESTVVEVRESPDNGEGVAVTYLRHGEAQRVNAGHCVLACYHSIIPHLCPDLPVPQKEALAFQVKRPLLVTNVLLRNSDAADKLGISGAYCPGRLHAATWLIKGVNVPDYHHDWNDPGPVVMQFWGSVAPPRQGMSPPDQHRASRQVLLGMEFEDFEREVRTTLDGMLGPAGFDAAEDIFAITVNRWPHGYARDYLDLWDPDWAPGQAPHEIARRRFGNIAFANADAGADAYMHVAIDQAWRAVNDLLQA